MLTLIAANVIIPPCFSSLGTIAQNNVTAPIGDEKFSPRFFLPMIVTPLGEHDT